MRQLSVVAGVLAMLAVGIAAVACMFTPLMSNPGPEAAGVLAVVGGVSLALAQAARAAQKSERGAFDDALGGLLLAALAMTMFILATAIGGALHRTCGPDRGYIPFFIVAAPVLVFQVALGTLVGRVLRGMPGRALLAMLLVELADVVWLALEWLREPSFRVASHLFVVVESDLLGGAPLTAKTSAFRFATLAFAAALLAFGTARFPRIRRAGLSTQAVSSPVIYAIAAALFVVGVVAHNEAKQLLMPKRAEMVARYALEKRRGPLVIHADPRDTRPRDVDALLAEGTLWIERLRSRLGVSGTEDIHVWVHATPIDRAKWTGASHVDFALPWRREVHIAGDSVPNRSLGHELAHVLAGELTDTALRLPTKLLFFDQAAITEGVAVAVTPELTIGDGLTIKELAAAMKRAGYAPDPAELFSAGSFFKEAPARAYISAGAVIESLIAASMPDAAAAIRTLYSTGSLEQAAGGTEQLEKLLADHQALLDALPLPPDSTVVAEARFAKPSILQQTCDPEKNELADNIRVMSREGRFHEALQAAQQAQALSAATLEDLYVDAAANRDEAAVLEIGERLKDVEDTDPAGRAEAYGDALWRVGRVRDAHATWLKAPLELRAFEPQRMLMAKRILGEGMLQRGQQAHVAKAALDVLVRGEARTAAFLALAGALGEPSEEDARVRSVGEYILARRLVQIGALDDGRAMMGRVIEKALLPKPFLEQGAVAVGTALLRKGDAEEAQRILFEAAGNAERPATRILLKDRAERAQRAVQAPPPPPVSTAASEPAWADRLLLGADDAGDLQ